MNIRAIDWPTNSKAAIELYLNFLIKVIKANNIQFPKKFQDPIEIRQMNGGITLMLVDRFKSFEIMCLSCASCYLPAISHR